MECARRSECFETKTPSDAQIMTSAVLAVSMQYGLQSAPKSRKLTPTTKITYRRHWHGWTTISHGWSRNSTTHLRLHCSNTRTAHTANRARKTWGREEEREWIDKISRRSIIKPESQFRRWISKIYTQHERLRTFLPGTAPGAIGMPLPAALPIPGPGMAAARPCLLASSEGGGPDSMLILTTSSPRRITNPSDRFSSRSTRTSSWCCCDDDNDDDALVSVVVEAVDVDDFLGLSLRNSSHSPNTKLRCLSNASIWPIKTRPSVMVTLRRQFSSCSSLEFLDKDYVGGEGEGRGIESGRGREGVSRRSSSPSSFALAF